MKAAVIPKPKRFRRAKKLGEILVGEDVVAIENGEAIDHSINNDRNHESYHISHTGDISSRKHLVNIRSGDRIHHAANKSGDDSKSIFHPQRYATLKEDEYDQCEQYKRHKTRPSKWETASVPSQLNPNQTGMKSIVHESTYDAYAFEQISNPSNSGLGCNISTINCSSSRPSDAFGFIAGKIGELLLRREGQPLDKMLYESGSDYPQNSIINTVNKALPTTLNIAESDLGFSQSDDKSSSVPDQEATNFGSEQKEQLQSVAFPTRMNRENSLLDIESAGKSEEHSFSTSPSGEDKQDRLEQLRQSKRAIEKGKLGLSRSQTIAIPRSSLYGSKEENIEDFRKLQVGSSITNKQEKNIYFRRKLALTATIILISIGVVFLAMALFWPAKIS